MAGKKLFDKKFVFALMIITVADVLVILLVRKLFGNEAAGFVGAAMATLLSVVLARFETLRFRKIPDDKSTWIDIPTINIWRVIVIAFSFGGAEAFLGFLLGYGSEEWLGKWGLFMVFAGAFVNYFVCSLLMAKAFIRLRYSTVGFAVLLKQILSAWMAFAMPIPETAMAVKLYGVGFLVGAQGVLWLLFGIVALFGVRVGLPSDKS